MKRLLLFFFMGIQMTALAGFTDPVLIPIPDSVRATAVYTELKLNGLSRKSFAGMESGGVRLMIRGEKKGVNITMQVPQGAEWISGGDAIERKGKALEFRSREADTASYRLMIATASDSAGNFTLYSGYAYLPLLNKWKLIGTARINGQWGYLKSLLTLAALRPKKDQPVQFKRTFFQRSNGSWKSARENSGPSPVINYFSEADSSRTALMEKAAIASQLIKEGKTMKETAGIFYQILEKGSGQPFKVTDTVTVYYKGYLFQDSSVFDQTQPGKPASFPLNRLIRGWQIGVPLINTGGKIILVIPSGLAYSIRTRSPKIPPNSTLVFEIEVLEAKAPASVR